MSSNNLILEIRTCPSFCMENPAENISLCPRGMRTAHRYSIVTEDACLLRAVTGAVALLRFLGNGC